MQKLSRNQLVARSSSLTDQEDHNTTQNLREFPRFLHSIGNGDDQPDTL